MDIIVGPLLQLILVVLQLFTYVLIASVILSWLVVFGIVNTGNRVVNVIGDFLQRLTEPALRPIRRFVPQVGGVDLSPLVLLLAIWLVQMWVTNILIEMGQKI